MKLVPPDTLALYDGAANRISLFTSDGGFVNSFGASNSVGIFGDGSVAIQLGVSASRSGTEVVGRGLRRLARADRAGDVLDSIALLPTTESFLLPDGRGAISWYQLHRTTYEVAPDAIYISTGERSEVLRYDMRGGEPAVIQVPQELVPVTTDELFQWLDSILAPGVVRRSDLDTVPEGRHLTTITDLILASSGELWAQETIRSESDPTHSWSIIDTETRTVSGRAILPGNVRPTHIGDDWILAVVRDSLGVERVQLFGIEGELQPLP
jgi:hypothetical protein